MKLERFGSIPGACRPTLAKNEGSYHLAHVVQRSLRAGFSLVIAFAMALGVLLTSVHHGGRATMPSQPRKAEAVRHADLAATIAEHGHSHDEGEPSEQIPGHVHGHNAADHLHEMADRLSVDRARNAGLRAHQPDSRPVSWPIPAHPNGLERPPRTVRRSMSAAVSAAIHHRRTIGTSMKRPSIGGRCGLRHSAASRASLPLVLLLASLAPAIAHGVAEGDKGYIQEISGIHLMPFVYLGAKHMMTGYDHLLFLFGVVFFLYRMKHVAIYVSLFALGHSTTMLLGVYFNIGMNAYIIDAIIGLSVVYKALDNMGAYQRWFGVPAEHQGRDADLRPVPRLWPLDQDPGLQRRSRTAWCLTCWRSMSASRSARSWP